MNAGAFNASTGGAGAFVTVPGFAVGDEVHFIFTGSAGTTLYLMGTDGGMSLLVLTNLNGSPQPVNYTVTGSNNDLTMEGNYGGGGEVTIRATCGDPIPPAPQTIDRTQAVTKAFLLSRIDGILLNDPTANSLRRRADAQTGTMTTAGMPATNAAIASNGSVLGGAMGLSSGLGNAMGLGASRFGDADADSAGSPTVQFSGSLSKMRREAAQAQQNKERMALGAGDGGSLPLAYETASPWDIWVEGRYSAFDDDAANLGRDGHVGVLYVGSDYRVTENMIVGALVQFDWAKDSSDVLASKVDGNGWMIGPYMSARIHDNVYFDLRAAWGRSNNDLDLAGVTGASIRAAGW